MTQITGGRVRFTKKVQLAQFEPIEAEAEYSFAVSEGDDESAVSFRAAAAAQHMVEMLINQKVERMVPTAIDTSNWTPATVVAVGPDLTTDKPARKPRTTPPPAVKVEVLNPPAEAVEDDLGLEDDSPNTVEVKHTENTVVVVDDLDLGLDEPAPPAEVTDVELTTAVARRNGELIKVYQEKEGEAAGKKGTLLIRALLKDKFNDAKIRELPQSQRHDFIKQLDALTYVKA